MCHLHYVTGKKIWEVLEVWRMVIWFFYRHFKSIFSIFNIFMLTVYSKQKFLCTFVCISLLPIIRYRYFNCWLWNFGKSSHIIITFCEFSTGSRSLVNHLLVVAFRSNRFCDLCYVLTSHAATTAQAMLFVTDFRTVRILSWKCRWHLDIIKGGTAAAVPPPFRPSEPALCGSCPLVTPYYCRLGDLLCLFV